MSTPCHVNFLNPIIISLTQLQRQTLPETFLKQNYLFTSIPRQPINPHYQSFNTSLKNNNKKTICVVFA